MSHGVGVGGAEDKVLTDRRQRAGTHRIGSLIANGLDLYPGGSRFESGLENWLVSVVFVVFPSPSMEAQECC
jgi:hypothetical protein